MYLSIIVLSLLGSIVSGFFCRKIGVCGAITYLSVIIITTILAIISFIEVGINNNPVSITLFKWLNSESFNINIGFHFDSLTVSYVCISFIWLSRRRVITVQGKSRLSPQTSLNLTPFIVSKWTNKNYSAGYRLFSSAIPR